MKYFKIAFMASIGWSVGQLAAKASYCVATKAYEAIVERLQNVPRFGEYVNTAQWNADENDGGFTVRGFYCDD